MPSNLKKMVHTRMGKTGESYQQALRHVRSHAASPPREPQGPGVPPAVHSAGLPPGAALPPVPQAIFPDVVRAPVNRAHLDAGAFNAPLPPHPEILPGQGTGGRATIPGDVRFTFFLSPTHHDLGWIGENFALPGRRFVVQGSQVHVEMPAGAAEAEALVEVNRYCEALRRHGLFVIRAQTYAEFVSAPASVQTIHSAGPDERARTSRAFREARRELLGPAAEPALVQGYDYLQDAWDIYVTCSMRSQVENAVFVPVYKSIESICAPLGGPDRARKSLGVAGELDAVKRVCNEASRDTRHAPAPGQQRRPVTIAELDDVMQKTASIFRAYERHLGLGPREYAQQPNSMAPGTHATERTCMYCSGPANSKEHIIASQIIEILKADPRGFPLPTHLKFSHRFGGPIVRTKKGKPGGTRSKSTLEFTLRVCARCNNGWMNDVDKDALPYLTEMIRGRPLTLGPAAQAKVAAWIAKVAVTSRPAHLPFKPEQVPAPVEKAWTDWLYTNHAAPPDWHVWVTRYDGAEPIIYSGEDIRVEDPRGASAPSSRVLVAHGVYATIVLGYLGIQLFGVDGPLPLPLDLERAPERVLRIWPPQATDVSWPPGHGYDDGNLASLASRLMGPA